MHQLCLASSLLLGLSSLSLSFALPTQDPSTSTTVGSESFASTSGVSENANAMETVVLAGVPKLTPDNTCGNAGAGQNKGYTCDPKAFKGGACCSSYGNCGDGPLYCGAGCQSSFGKCDGTTGPNQPTPQPPATSLIPNPHPSIPAQPKPLELTCGPAFGNKRCPDNLCCSAAGYCGDTTDYCMVPQNCQKEFGRCDSDNVPAGGTTSTDPRPLIGSVSYDKPIQHCLKERTIALTFDDGPGDQTSALLDLLAIYDAKATFFISGNVNGKGEIDVTKKWFDVIRRMVAEGHQVASHTFDHVRLSTTPSELRKLEMYKNERALANIIGKYPTYLRAPYTDCTVESGCSADMKALGYHLVDYDLTTEDYLHPQPAEIQQSKDIVKEAFAKAPENGNFIVIQHDIIEQSSGNLTEYTLQLVRNKGWEAVTVGTCMGDPVDNWYREPSWISPGNAPMDACVVSRGRFCGTIPAFDDKSSCVKSAGECMKQTEECPRADGSSVEGSSAEGCDKFANICRLQVAFCAVCGGEGQRSCETKQFEYKVE